MKIANYDVRAFIIGRRTITRPVYDYLNPGSNTEQFYIKRKSGFKATVCEYLWIQYICKDYPIFDYRSQLYTRYLHQCLSIRNQRRIPTSSVRTFDNIRKQSGTYLRLLVPYLRRKVFLCRKWSIQSEWLHCNLYMKTNRFSSKEPGRFYHARNKAWSDIQTSAGRFYPYERATTILWIGWFRIYVCKHQSLFHG